MGADGTPPSRPRRARAVSARQPSAAGIRLSPGPETGWGGRAGGPPGQDSEAGNDSLDPPQAKGARWPTGSAGGRGRSDCREGKCAPGSAEEAPGALEEAVVARQTQTTIKGRKPGRSAQGPVRARGPPNRVPQVGEGARDGRVSQPGSRLLVRATVPRRVARGASEAARHPPSKSEMIPSSCALTAGSDMVARGPRDARRAAARKRPGRPGPCALAGAPRPRSRRAELAGGAPRPPGSAE